MSQQLFKVPSRNLFLSIINRQNHHRRRVEVTSQMNPDLDPEHRVNPVQEPTPGVNSDLSPYYRQLGLRPGATPTEIYLAYSSVCKRHLPHEFKSYREFLASFGK